MRMNRMPSRILLGLAVVALAGCGRGITSTPGDAPNLEEWTANVKARPAPPLDPLPVMQQFESFECSSIRNRVGVVKLGIRFLVQVKPSTEDRDMKSVEPVAVEKGLDIRIDLLRLVPEGVGRPIHRELRDDNIS